MDGGRGLKWTNMLAKTNACSVSDFSTLVKLAILEDPLTRLWSMSLAILHLLLCHVQQCGLLCWYQGVSNPQSLGPYKFLEEAIYTTGIS